ncbi:MAG: hypothetical protein Kow0040_10000 [Thermogutta sp.]
MPVRYEAARPLRRTVFSFMRTEGCVNNLSERKDRPANGKAPSIGDNANTLSLKVKSIHPCGTSRLASLVQDTFWLKQALLGRTFADINDDVPWHSLRKC